jgi:excisionase family DNA binding protein
MKLLTLKEAADRLAISLATIRSWVWHRKIEVVKIGRCVRIKEEVLDDLISRSTVPPKLNEEK